MLLPTALGLLLALSTAYSHDIENPQITTPPSPSSYTAALTQHSLYLLNQRADTHTSLGSADALMYCQGSVHGCSAQLTLYDSCSSLYSTDLKYLYCLCTTGYYSALSQCEACSASLGAIGWDSVSSDAASAKSECASLSSSFGTDTKTGTKTGKGHTGTTAAAEATSTLPSQTSATSSSMVVTMPTEPYAGLAGQPTIPGDDGVAAPTSSGAAVAVDRKGAGMMAGVVLCLGGAVLL